MDSSRAKIIKRNDDLGSFFNVSRQILDDAFTNHRSPLSCVGSSFDNLDDDLSLGVFGSLKFTGGSGGQAVIPGDEYFSSFSFGFRINSQNSEIVGINIFN